MASTPARVGLTTGAAGESSWLAVAGTHPAHPGRTHHSSRPASPRDAPRIGLLLVLCRLLGCGCLRRQRDRGSRPAASGRGVSGSRGQQPEARGGRAEALPHSIPFTHGGRGAAAGGSTELEQDARTSLLPKGKGLDSSFSCSPELPPPSIPKGFKMMEDWDMDADVCPTCLECYDADNPMIITQCKHHFHLACIYEWLERSRLCPVCSKVMRDADGQKFLEL